MRGSYAFTARMELAGRIMQSPGKELFALLEEEVAKNPLLYWKHPQKTLFHELPFRKCSFSEHIAAQIRDGLSTNEQPLAWDLWEELDERGYCGRPLDKWSSSHLAVRKKMLLFDPLGVASISLQECLLAQLQVAEGKSILRQLIAHHFDDLLHQRFSQLSKKLRRKAHLLRKEVQEGLWQLHTKPKEAFEETQNAPLFPDVIVSPFGEIAIDPAIPPLYLKALHPRSCAARAWESSAGHLEKSLQKRLSLLNRLTQFLLQKQKGFFKFNEPLTSLTVKETALALDVHPATLRRILANKSLSFEGEIFPMHTFFSREARYASQQKTLRLIEKIIRSESQKNPLSDTEITYLLAKKGCYLARRTVTKYRQRLKIPKKLQRREVF